MRALSKLVMIFLICSAVHYCAYACDIKSLKDSPLQVIKDCASNAKKGDMQAEYNVGAAYFKLAQYDQAFLWMKKSADQGHIWGQYQLATLYDRGLGTKPNIDMAKKYYLLAANNGDMDAMQNLGSISLASAHKSGSVSEYETARNWFYKSACLGQAKSQHNLSLMMAKGEVIPRDYVNAYYWANKAQINGYKDSQYTIANLERLMPKSELVKAKKNAQESYKTYCSIN